MSNRARGCRAGRVWSKPGKIVVFEKKGSVEAAGCQLLDGLSPWPRYTRDVEQLGPYVLHEDTTGSSRLPRVFNGQDSRTGIPVLVYPDQQGPLPPSLVGCLPWIEAIEGAWVAEQPMGAVVSSSLAGGVEQLRLTYWARCLVQALQGLEEDGLVHGALSPERIWVKGTRAWIEGMGLPQTEPVKPDRPAVLEVLQTWAAHTWPTLSWAREIEEWAAGRLDSAMVVESLTALLPNSKTQIRIPTVRPATQAELDPPVAPSASPVERVIVPAPVPAAPELPAWGPPETGPADEPGFSAADQTPPPRRIRIEDTGQPSFPVYEPSAAAVSRRSVPTWWWVIALVVIGLAVGVWWGFSRPAQMAVGASVVRFEVFPEGTQAKLVVLEAPQKSSLADRAGEVFAEIPGPVTFDTPGQYLLSVRAANREPQEFALTVPKPGGIRIRLR